uniref:Macrophage migration inhibitory factor n=1 Tax=Alexandrium monilatum TaxID=311494 RepID=A0A7S4V553_9DINO
MAQVFGSGYLRGLTAAPTSSEARPGAMPLVTCLTDSPVLIEKSPEVAKALHECVKSALGKPDMYITVAVSKAECVCVNGEPQSAVVQVDSIGGALGPFTAAACEKLAAIGGIQKEKVTCTFRSVDGKEFAMNGKTIF